MTTVRQSIIDSIELALDDIVGLNVVTWRQYATGIGDMPLVVVRDTAESIDERSSYSENRSLSLQITVMASGASSVDNVRGYAGDINKRIGEWFSDGNSWVYEINYSDNVLEVDHGEDIIAALTMNFICLYRVKNYREDISANV